MILRKEYKKFVESMENKVGLSNSISVLLKPAKIIDF
jgi:hypothetical protein